jgi:hypothetical protein
LASESSLAFPPSCWVVTDGKAGMESQCMGLAEALSVSPVIKHVSLRAPWRQLTPFFRWGGIRQFAPLSDELAEPWPKLLIATGRHSVAASLLIKRLSDGYTRTVQIQNPVISARHFDLVVVPQDLLGDATPALPPDLLGVVQPDFLGADLRGVAPRRWPQAIVCRRFRREACRPDRSHGSCTTTIVPSEDVRGHRSRWVVARAIAGPRPSSPASARWMQRR